MKASDVVSRLASRLPLFTDKFTRTIQLGSVTRDSGTDRLVAACLSEHQLKVGDGVAIVGALTPIAITSLTRSGAVGTLVTSTPHDLTQRTLNAAGAAVVISGAAEPEFVGTFSGAVVVDRNTVRFAMADAGPVAATGSPVLENGESQLRSYDGLYKVVEATGPASFSFLRAPSTLPSPLGTIEARVKPRVSSAVNLERAVAAYTEQKLDALWGFVVMDGVNASKNRMLRSDAVDNTQKGHHFRQQIIEDFTFYVFVPASDSIGGRQGSDVARDLLRPICRSILMHAFPSGLHASQLHPVNFVGHGSASYDGGLYVHGFSFSQVSELTFEDTVGPDLDVAFRDIDLSLFVELPGAGDAAIALKAEPALDDVNPYDQGS